MCVHIMFNITLICPIVSHDEHLPCQVRRLSLRDSSEEQIRCGWDSVLVSKVMPDTSRFGDKAPITVDGKVLRNVT